MTEILQIIVLACYVSPGNSGHSRNLQKDCQKKLIKCMDKKTGMREWYSKDLKECLLERK